MKSFNKILSLVLALTMLVSLACVPSAFAAIKYPVGDTSDYEVAATFVKAAIIAIIRTIEISFFI